MAGAYKKYQGQGFHIIGLECQDSSNADIDKVARNTGATFQIATGGSLKGAIVNRIPRSFLFGPDGKLAAEDPRGKLLEGKVEVLLKDVPKPEKKEIPEKKKEPSKLVTLKDGTKISAEKVVDFGEAYSIKSAAGKFITIQKGDVEKIENEE